jgi:GT2 family glycosyltransferase
MLVQAKAFWSVGGLDTHFFAHMEEIDLCWRLQNAGHQIWYCPTAQIYHVGGGTLQYGSPRKTFLDFRKNIRQHLQNRRQIPHKKSLWTMQGVALKSIVFEYFVLKKRDF